MSSMNSFGSPHMKFALAVGLFLLGPLAAVAGSDVPISPEEWRALTTGKTLDYHKDGELYGREFYKNEEGDVVFRFPNGQCAEGRWAYAEEKYCFLFGGKLHCFIHIMRDGEIVKKGGGQPVRFNETLEPAG